MPRCLVTGATGFVGANLVERLRRDGCDVRCLVRASSHTGRLSTLGAELVQGSLHDDASLAAATTDIDVVYHLAGRIAAHRHAEFTHDNVEGTRTVARACAAQPHPPVLVFVSSLAAGGPGTIAHPRRESDPPQPVSAYGRSKLAAEGAAIEAAGATPLSIVRPPMVFGQGDRASLQIFRSMKFLPIHASPGLRKFQLSLVHVTDLCDALIRVAAHGERTKKVSGTFSGDASAANAATADEKVPDTFVGAGRYYVCADRTITYADLGRLAATAAGWSVAAVPMPRPLVWAMGTVGEVLGRLRRRPSIMNFDKARESLAAGWVCSDEKIRHDLGYQPAAPLETRLAETVAWYRAHGWL